MKKYFIILFFFVMQVHGQSNIAYYKDWKKKKPTTKEKAVCSVETSTLPDGRTVEEIRNMTGSFISRLTTDSEPMGYWPTDGGLDYDFELKYIDSSTCQIDTNIFVSGDRFQDNPSKEYVAPKILKFATFEDHLMDKTTYPEYAKDEGFMGNAKIEFTISETGEVEHIMVVKSSGHPILDKESVRVIRLLKISSPATLNGKPIAICMKIPFVFKLE